MPLEPQTSQESPKRSPTIQDSADKIMALLEQERLEERQITASASNAYHRNLLEDYQRRSRVFQDDQARKLMQTERELTESRIRFDELQNRKLADEAMLQTLSVQNQVLKDECNDMREQMIRIQNLAYMSGAQASHAATVSELKRYGIVYWGPNSLSFEEPWLQLWNQYVTTADPQDKMSSDHRITQKDMEILLENFIYQLRRDKNSIQTLEQHLSIIRDEHAFRSQLTNKHTKLPSMEMKTEIAPLTCHPHDDDQDYQTGHFIKSEPGLEISTI